MGVYNQPCQAELTYMHVLPIRLTGMIEAMTKLTAAMDRLSATIERQNEQAHGVQDKPDPISGASCDRACRSSSPHTDRTPAPPYSMTEEVLNG